MAAQPWLLRWAVSMTPRDILARQAALLLGVWWAGVFGVGKKLRRWRIRCFALLAGSHLVVVALHLLYRWPRVGPALRRVARSSPTALLLCCLAYNLLQSPLHSRRVRAHLRQPATRARAPGQRCWLLMLSRALRRVDPEWWATTLAPHSANTTACRRRVFVQELLGDERQWRTVLRLVRRHRGRFLCPRYPPPARRLLRRSCPAP